MIKYINDFRICENKAAEQMCSTGLCFTKQMIQVLCLLNPKLQDFNQLQLLGSSIYVGSMKSGFLISRLIFKDQTNIEALGS